MDAITLLKHDHKAVKELFQKFERAGDNARKTKRSLVDQMIEELSMHAAIEEQIFYPAIRAEMPDADDDVLEALEEHHVAKWLLAELDGMPPDHERFDAKTTVLIESVRHHIKEEEGILFPKVRGEMGRKRLAELGEQMEAAKRIAPKRPHPKSPDSPPGNLSAGRATGVVDRARDAGRSAVHRAVAARR
jgi:iron-sulfur cluster repair protein YtfE (RIC family)